MYVGDPRCDFCATLKYHGTKVRMKCATYNLKQKVKRARPYQGIIINSYFCDNHERIVEYKSKTFPKLNYCPICGIKFKKMHQRM